MGDVIKCIEFVYFYCLADVEKWRANQSLLRLKLQERNVLDVMDDLHLSNNEVRKRIPIGDRLQTLNFETVRLSSSDHKSQGKFTFHSVMIFCKKIMLKHAV